MPEVKEVLRSGSKEDLWQICCGFLDLDLDQFMAIQNRLLIEQIDLLNNCQLGRKIFKCLIPQDVAEFRKRVNLTTYEDYCPELSQQHEEVLPAKPVSWQHTSGRSIEYPFKWESIKWFPVTQSMEKEIGIISGALGILSSCKEKGDASRFNKNPSFIYTVGPRPYTSGNFAYMIANELDAICMPPLEIAEKMSPEERVKLSFKQALSEGFDFFFGVTVALVSVGEQINQQMSQATARAILMQPRALLRMIKGLVKSKLAKRKLLPKDIWDVKGIICSGTDGIIFRELIKNTWGRYPLNVLASTEAGFIATQTWDYESMTFFPSMNFLEFIPESEFIKCQDNKSYAPQTVTLNEVKAGGTYELVITNFHGGPLIRYRTGDKIKITSLQNAKLNIHIPQMEFVGRVDDVIDVGAFVRLTEKVIWQAISNTGVSYVDWAACKEADSTKSILHIYLELKDQCGLNERKLAEKIYAELKNMDSEFLYGNMEDILNTMPVEVTFLQQGAFERYINFRRSQGADLMHLKPRHINPSEKELSILKSSTPQVTSTETAPEPVKVS